MQSPWVSHRGHSGCVSPMGCVCSGIVLRGLGSLRVRTGLGALGSLLCIRQYGAPGIAPLRHGVPLPVTPWQGTLRVDLSCWSWARSSATSARRASIFAWDFQRGGSHLGRLTAPLSGFNCQRVTCHTSTSHIKCRTAV